MDKTACAVWGLQVQMLRSPWLLFQCLDKVEVGDEDLFLPTDILLPRSGQRLVAWVLLFPSVNGSRSPFN